MSASIEKQFARRLSKAGWHTYRDEATGRVVTNAYIDEMPKLSKITGLIVEVVTEPNETQFGPTCAQIGPRRW